MKRKLFSLLLAALLLASLLPASALPVSAATESIDTVSVRAITPFAGQHPVFESQNYSEVTEETEHDGYDIHTYTDAASGWKNGVMWLDRNGNVMTESDTFEAYQTYEVLVLTYAKEGYAFPKSPSTNVTAKVNDLAAKAAAVGAGLKQGKDVIAVRYTFTCRKEKTVISKVAVTMDMSQMEKILVLGKKLQYPTYTVTEASEINMYAGWKYKATEADQWKTASANSEIKPGFYRLSLSPSISDKHLSEIYQFSNSVAFYLNGTQKTTVNAQYVNYFDVEIGVFTVNAQETVESVTVSPNNITLYRGDTRQFTATVLPSGVKDKSVTWSVINGDGGTTISADGLLTVGAEQTPCYLQVIATSQADDRIRGQATVAVDLPDGQKQSIESVSVYVPVPFAGKTVSYEAEEYGYATGSEDDGKKYALYPYTNAGNGWKNGVRWTYNGASVAETTRFVAGRKYDVTVLLWAQPGYQFPTAVSKLQAQVNAASATAVTVIDRIKGDRDVIAVTYQFTARTAKITIDQISVSLDTTQIKNMMVPGKQLETPTFTVLEGNGPHYSFRWEKIPEDNSSMELVSPPHTIQAGYVYQVALRVELRYKHQKELYKFADQVPVYHNGVLIDTLHFDSYNDEHAYIGTYRVPKSLPGDMDGDGDKDTDDAVYLLLHVMFGETDYPIANPDKDINNDSKVDTDDAVYLLLHVMFGAVDYPI